MWDSRFNCDDEDDSERTLLATFANVDRLSAIAVVDDGSYVRPTDQVDMAMVKAVAKMTVKKGSSAVQQAAKQRQVSDLRAISQKLPSFFSSNSMAAHLLKGHRLHLSVCYHHRASQAGKDLVRERNGTAVSAST